MQIEIEYNGKWRVVNIKDDLQALLEHCLAEGIKWEINFLSIGDKEERKKCAQVDLQARCARAFINGRPVIFHDKIYHIFSTERMQRLAKVSDEFETALEAARGLLFVEKDDKDGLWIGEVKAVYLH